MPIVYQTLLGSKKPKGTAVQTDVVQGKTFSNDNGIELTGSRTAVYDYPRGNAGTAEVLAGKTFSTAQGYDKTGTMPNRGAVTSSLTSQSAAYTIPAGYHNGSGKVTANITNLTGANIKAGVAVGGVTGTAPVPSGNAGAAQVLAGYTFSKTGAVGQTGTMPNRGAVSSSLTSQSAAYTIPAGYHNGSGKVTANITNLTGANIKAGVSVGGVTGTVRQASGNAVAADVRAGKTFSNSSGSNLTGTWNPVQVTLASERELNYACTSNGNANFGRPVIYSDIDILGLQGHTKGDFLQCIPIVTIKRVSTNEIYTSECWFQQGPGFYVHLGAPAYNENFILLKISMYRMANITYVKL